MGVWELRAGFGLEHLRQAARPDPVPGPGEVLLAMRAASLNYRDTLAVRGGYGPRYTLPLIPLSDGVGEVVATGEGVGRVRVGDRVCPTFFLSWLGGPPTRAARRRWRCRWW
jgi:NADPH:quinone reductase-like Zn-dependent oxidoreductase